MVVNSIKRMAVNAPLLVIPDLNIRYSDFSSYLLHTMLDTTDLKRELDELTNRLGKTQEYL
jgi:hypothetical protein